MTGPLVNSPEANDFRSLATTNSGRKAMLGDASKLPIHVRGHVERASEALTAGLAKIERLADDPTKTHVAKHETGKEIADKVVATILDGKARIGDAGRNLIAEGNAAITSRFALQPGRDPVYNRIVDWINERSKEPNGPQRIREAMKQDPNIVVVLTHFPPYTLNLADDVREQITLDGYIHHATEATETIAQGQALTECAAKYDRVVRGVFASFYNKAVAEQASRRVTA